MFKYSDTTFVSCGGMALLLLLKLNVGLVSWQAYSRAMLQTRLGWFSTAQDVPTSRKLRDIPGFGNNRS
jgi:hypothetical protein